jgi:Uma2 family endonuclease
MSVQLKKMTATEFLTLPVSNLPHELLNGEATMSPAPSLAHQRLLLRLAKLVERLIPNGEIFIAPVDVVLDELDVLQPDLVWVAEASLAKSVDNKYLKGAPDLVVEIFSPGTVRRDKKDKFHLYEKFGVREYCMIDPDEKWLEIWQLKEARFVLVDIFGPNDPCISPLLGKLDMQAVFPD